MPKTLEEYISTTLAEWKDDPSSKPQSPHDDETMARIICESKIGLEKKQDAALKEHGPALVAIAATIKPHLRQRGHELEVVEKDGKELVKIPIARKGVYRHPKAPDGKLVFNQAFFEKMISNHNNRVTDYNVALDLRHKGDEGALAWVDVDDGGWLELEGSWLNAYGKPTDEKAKDLIRSKRYRYASAEFFYNYKSNRMYKLSTDDMEEVDDKELLQEVTVPKVLKFNDVEIALENIEGEEALFQLGQEDANSIEKFIGDVSTQVADLNGKVDEADSKLEEANAQVTSLKAEIKELKGEDEDEIPPAVKARLEALEEENTQLSRQRMLERVAFTLEKARNRVDEKTGFGLDKVVLDLAEAGLKFENYEQGDVSVKLEDGNTVDGVLSFYRNLWKVALEQIPGTVPRKSQTHGEDIQLQQETTSFSEEELKAELEGFEQY